MARWIIYNKDGSEKAMTGGITVGHCTLPELEYHGIWMLECFVTFTVKSFQPVNWQLGDYLMYRGEKFVLNYDPSVIKKARTNTYGEAYVYESIKFNSLSVELTDIEFLDVVLSDNHIHYTSLPSFSFFANDIDDLADRLQANVNRYCRDNGFAIADWWIFLTSSLSRTVARGRACGETDQEKLQFENLFRTAWNANYSDGETYDTGKFNQNISVGNQSVSQMLSVIKSSFDLNFTNKGRQIVIGAAAREVEHIFRYGKKKGLYEIERVVDSEQQVITKLIAYGGSTNLPTRYYADINKVCFADVLSIEQGVAKLDVLFSRDRFNGYQDPVFPYPLYKVLFHVDGGQKEGFVSDHINPVTVGDGSCYLISSNLEVGDRIYFDSGVVVDKWPSGHFSYINEGKILPDNLAVNNLMLPGFPTQSLYDWVIANNGIAVQDGRNNSKYGRATWTYNNVTYDAFFSKDKLNPYILSLNFDEIGVRESTKFFDGSDDTEDIHPSIENTGADHLLHADIIEDNGVFEEGNDPDNFHVTIPSLGEGVEFNSLIKEETTISMKDGYCGGRDFKVVSATKNQNGTWDVILQREPDEALQLYFPYSDRASRGLTPIADEAYQLRGSDIENYDGDKFVIIGIDMPDTYIEFSSSKLLAYSLEFLDANDYVRYTYNPKVDEIFMAREHDSAPAGTSLHDNLKEGDLLLFEDDDLDIQGNIFIDTLTIKEYGNNGIPTYEVTLKETKTVGTIERIKQQIDSLSGKGGSNGSSAAGLSSSQVKSLINTYGDERFIRRDIDDETNNDLTTKNLTAKEKVKTDVIQSRTPNAPVTVDDDLVVNEDVQIEGDATIAGQSRLKDTVTFGADNSAGSTHNKVMRSTLYNAGFAGWQIDEYGNLEVESLKVRSVLEVEELLINRLQAQEGDTIYTDNDQIVDIEAQTDSQTGETTYILTFKEKWEGYFTAQRYGNILKGIINTLAANYVSQQQGHGNVIDPSSPDWEEQEEDDASYQGSGNKYFTSWMYVIADRNTDQTLELNQVRVALFPDNEVAQTKNFPPCINMVVGRWGCLNYSEDPAEKASIKKRQSFFYLSSSQGRFMKLNSVSSPILTEGNFGTVLGEIPDFIRQWDSWQRLVTEHPHLNDRDYLYAQGLIYEDLVHVDITGAPVPVTVYCGDWVDGSQMQTPTVGNGIYYNTKWNNTNKQFEIHTVRHNNGTWMCLISQPSIDNGVLVYHEPKWNSQYWRLIDGNGNYSIEFVSTMGDAFYVGHVSTVLTPHLFYGNVDISSEIDVQYWSWTRETEQGSTAADTIWNNNHVRTRVLNLTNEDMPTGWGRDNKAIFTCTVVVNDGNNQVIIQNQVIA